MKEYALHIMVRGYGDGVLQFEKRITVTGKGFKGVTTEQIAELARFSRFMLEFEFLDEPDNPDRFMRFGNNPTCVKLPKNARCVMELQVTTTSGNVARGVIGPGADEGSLGARMLFERPPSEEDQQFVTNWLDEWVGAKGEAERFSDKASYERALRNLRRKMRGGLG